MGKFIKIIICIFLGISMFININLAAEESSKNIDTLMGLAIQKYLEGETKTSISYLDEILTEDPDNNRARKLLEKVVDRLTQEIRKKKSYSTDMQFIKIGLKHIPESESIKRNYKILQEDADPALKEKRAMQKKESDKKKEIKRKEKVNYIVSAGFNRKLNNLNNSIARINKSISNSEDNINLKVGDIKSKIDQLSSSVADIGKSSQKSSSLFRIMFILVLAGLGGTVVIYFTLRTENAALTSNIIKERKLVEDLKLAYNKDTQELSKKLMEYGKSYQRADELEKNWQKIIGILERLTEGGSSNRVVLEGSPGGRKAVTGVDPRVRARADSVEIIAEIFKNSPRAPEMLKPFLDDNDNRTRGNAAVAYYQYDPEKSLAVLQGMTASADKWMRLSAAWSLGEIGDPSTSKILEKLLDDDDMQVKIKARASLEKILGERADPSS